VAPVGEDEQASILGDHVEHSQQILHHAFAAGLLSTLTNSADGGILIIIDVAARERPTAATRRDPATDGQKPAGRIAGDQSDGSFGSPPSHEVASPAGGKVVLLDPT
jgi:hypothetical protein